MNSNQSPTSSSSPLYTRRFLMIWAANFFALTTIGSFNLFPLFIKDHGGSEFDIGVIMGAVVISSLLIKPWIAEMIDRLGRKRSYLTAMGSFAVFPLVYLLFDGDISAFYVPLFVVRILHGFGMALCYTSVLTFIADIIPQERLSEGIGMFGVTGLIGMAVGPTISEPIIRIWGFNAFFYVNCMIPLVSFFLTLPIPETFVLRNKKAETISFFSVVARKKIWVICLITAFVGVGFATHSSFVAPYAEELGLTSIASFFIGYSLAAVLARVFGARLADRIGETRVIPWAFLVYASGFLSLLLVHNSLLLFLSGGLTGLGHGFLYPALNALVIRNEPIQARSKITAAFSGSIDLGMIAGSFSLGYVGELVGYQPIFVITTVALIGGCLLVGVFRKTFRGFEEHSERGIS